MTKESFEEKKKLINCILSLLHKRAIIENKPSISADTFWKLCFMENDKLRKIANLCKE